MLQVWGIVAVWKGAGVEKCAKLEKKRGELSGVSLRACVCVCECNMEGEVGLINQGWI